MKNDSVATTIGFIHDFLANATIEGVASCTAEQAQHLADVLHCDTPDGPEFAVMFPDSEITAYRDPHGNPLHGGRSQKYWARQSAWNPTAILERQRDYIRSKLLRNARYKAFQLLNGRRFTEHMDLSPETEHIFNDLRDWLASCFPSQEGSTTD